MSNCATKLQPYLAGAVQSLGASLNDYAPIVISICQNGTDNIDAGNRLVSCTDKYRKLFLSLYGSEGVLFRTVICR